MTSVITGDIIRSKKTEPIIWLEKLKKALTFLEPNTTLWKIYRGDSFQIEIPKISNSFIMCLYIKSCIKTIKGLDVRLAIGIGNKTFQGKDVTESNGEAFIFSGETLETLKREKVNLKIKTASVQLNNELNLYFKLALIPMNNWSVNSSELVKLSLENPKTKQSELGKRLGINQNAISSRLKRAHLEVVLELDKMYRQKTQTL